MMGQQGWAGGLLGPRTPRQASGVGGDGSAASRVPASWCHCCQTAGSSAGSWRLHLQKYLANEFLSDSFKR